MRRRYITGDLIERYGWTAGPPEIRAQDGQPAPLDPAAPNFVSTSTVAQEGVVDTEKMGTENTELAMSSQVLAAVAPMRPFDTRDDETMEQEGPESKRQRSVAGLPVCSLLPLVDEILVSYVATHEIDEKPVYDHKTGERLSPHSVKVGRQTEHDAMTSCLNVFRWRCLEVRKSDVNGLMG